MIQGYTSRTGSKRTLAALWEHGWRLLVNAYGVHRCEGFRYAIDNGAAQQVGKRNGSLTQREKWDPGRYSAVLESHGRGADWIVAPDIVAGGLDSLRRSESWLPTVSQYAMPLIAVQDGMEPADVWPLLGAHCGIFVGGSTEWKLGTLPRWGEVSRETGCHLHVGRVNSQTRIAFCEGEGAHSFDGTCALYAKNVPMLTTAVNQPSLPRMFDVPA